MLVLVLINANISLGKPAECGVQSRVLVFAHVLNVQEESGITSIVDRSITSPSQPVTIVSDTCWTQCKLLSRHTTSNGECFTIEQITRVVA